MWGFNDILRERNNHSSKYTNFLIFDIETIPDEDMIFEIADNKEKEKFENDEFLPHAYHRIVALSYMIVKNGDVDEYISKVSDNEANILNTFWNTFRNSHTKNDKNKITDFPVLITINGKDFDVPVIITRTLKHIKEIDEKGKFYISVFFDNFDKWEKNYPNYSNRYTLFHIDIPIDIFGKKISLKKLCHLAGIPVKQEGDGKEVKTYFDDGDFEKIARYCSEDVKATASLFALINQYFFYRKYNFPLIEYINEVNPQIIIEV